MAEILSNDAARRFLDLDVEEVSLVDTPANEQPFLTAKRKGTEDEMSGVNTETQGDASGATKVAVEVAKAESDVVAAAMAQVTALVDGIAKAAGITDSEVEKSEGTSDVRKVFEKQLKNAGLAGEAITKAMVEFDKACGGTMSTQTTKNKEAAAEQTAAADQSQSAPSVDDSVLATLDTIQKAKAFTPARLAKLAEALETLQKLMMDVIPHGVGPKTSTPTVNQHSNPNTTRDALVGTQKNADGESELQATLKAILAKLEPKEVATTKSAEPTAADAIVDTLKSIQERLTKIEQARPASNAEGDDEKQRTQKANGTFWKGIL